MNGATKSKATRRTIDPRLQRILDLVGVAYERLQLEPHDQTFDALVGELVEQLRRGGVATLEGATRTIRALAVDAAFDSRVLDECVRIAEEHVCNSASEAA